MEILIGVTVPGLRLGAVLVLALVGESSLVKDGLLRWLHWRWASGFWKAWSIQKPPHAGALWCVFGWEVGCRDALVWVWGSHFRPKEPGQSSAPPPRGSAERAERLLGLLSTALLAAALPTVWSSCIPITPTSGKRSHFYFQDAWNAPSQQ